MDPRAEIGVEEIQQTTASLQVTVPYALYEYFTHVEDDDDDDDEDYVDKIAINGEDFVNRDEYKERIERGDCERDIDDHEIEPNVHDDEIFDCGETEADNVINVQNITNKIPTYAPPAFSFSANTWANMIDPSNIEIPSVSIWKEGMNFSKGLTFANEVEVKCALTIYAFKENKHFVISR